MTKAEEDFITTYYHNVINEKVGNISYNGTRHYLSKKEIQKLKPMFKSLEELLKNTRPKIQHEKSERKEGGLLPLLALIPLIASVAGGVGGVTAGVATAVAKSNENKEQVRHNAEMERAAKEKSAKENQEQLRHNAEMERLAKEKSGTGMTKYDSSDEEIEEIKHCIQKLQGHGFQFI